MTGPSSVSRALPLRRWRQASQQLRHRQPRNGILQVGGNLDQRLENETPFADPRVGHDQARFIDDGVAKEQEIEVQCTRRSSKWTLPPACSLEAQKRVQQSSRRQSGPPDRSRVKKPWLRTWRLDRLGLVSGRKPHVLQERTKPRVRERQVGRTVAQVRSDADGDAGRSTQSIACA